MSQELIIGLITASLGIVIGFLGNYFIAKYNARSEIKKSISESRAKSYLELWQLCDKDIHTRKKQKERHEKLGKWYAEGGGLLLPFKATDRFVGALNLLQKSFDDGLSDTELENVIHNLSWLRTEMKYEVGSYSRKEANKVLPNTIQ